MMWKSWCAPTVFRIISVLPFINFSRHFLSITRWFMPLCASMRATLQRVRTTWRTSQLDVATSPGIFVKKYPSLVYHDRFGWTVSRDSKPEVWEECSTASLSNAMGFLATTFCSFKHSTLSWLGITSSPTRTSSDTFPAIREDLALLLRNILSATS